MATDVTCVHCAKNREMIGADKYPERFCCARLLVRLYVRDGGRCGICLLPTPVPYSGKYDATLAANPMRPSIDHIVPRKFQGETTDENIRLTHALCNLRRSDYEHYRPPPTFPPGDHHPPKRRSDRLGFYRLVAARRASGAA